MAVFYDSVNPAAIPAGTDACLYADGDYAQPESAASAASRFNSVLWITVDGGTSAAAFMSTLADYEPGNPVYDNQGALAAWAGARISAGKAAVVYCDLSNLAKAVTALGAVSGKVYWWLATLDDDERTQAEMLALVTALKVADVTEDVTADTLWAQQYGQGGSGAYDISTLYGAWPPVLPTPPPPAPEPPAAAEEETNMQLPQGKGTVSLVCWATMPKGVYFLTDVSGLNDGNPTSIRVALHNSGSNWDVKTVTLTVAEPYYELTLPQDDTAANGATFSREDNGPVVGVTWA